MGRNRKGSGSVFQRTYRDAKGKLRKTKNWYIEFVAGNRTMREATDFTKRSDAAEFLKKRIAGCARREDRPVAQRHVRRPARSHHHRLHQQRAEEPRRSEDDAAAATRCRVRRNEGDRHHDHVGRAVQDAPAEGQVGAGHGQPRARVAEAHVQARAAAGHGGDHAVHLDAGRAQRAQGFLRARSVPGDPQAPAGRVPHAVRDRLHHRLADEVGAADAPMAARRFRRQGTGCGSMRAKRRTRPPAASSSSRRGCAKRSNVSASSCRRWRSGPSQ